MDRRTRQQLKHDEFKDSLVIAEEFIKDHAKEIVNYAIIVVVVVGLAMGLRYYTDRQEASANADLGVALTTFRGYVGQPTPGETTPNSVTFATAQEKYKKALEQFNAIINKYTMIPRPKAVDIARYQAGVCQSLLDDHAGAIQTLTEASTVHDTEIASMAKFALAGELVQVRQNGTGGEALPGIGRSPHAGRAPGERTAGHGRRLSRFAARQGARDLPARGQGFCLRSHNCAGRPTADRYPQNVRQGVGSCRKSSARRSRRMC